jgi:ankyrin repeat protein
LPDYLGVEFTTINSSNIFGSNALHCVCIWGDVERAKLLIRNGININAIGEHGYTPIHEAVAHEKIEVVKILLEARVLLTQSEFGTPIDFAKNSGNTELLNILTDYASKNPDNDRTSTLYVFDTNEWHKLNKIHMQIIDDKNEELEKIIDEWRTLAPSATPHLAIWCSNGKTIQSPKLV